MLALLEISQTYDSIDQAMLLHVLRTLGLLTEQLGLLRGLYADTKAMVQRETLITRHQILGKCLFCSLRSSHPTLIYEHELKVKKGLYGVFIVPISAYVLICT